MKKKKDFFSIQTVKILFEIELLFSLYHFIFENDLKIGRCSSGLDSI